MKKYGKAIKEFAVVVCVAISLSALSYYIKQERVESYRLGTKYGVEHGISLGLDTVIDILTLQKQDTNRVTGLCIQSKDTVYYYLSPKRIILNPKKK